MGVRILYGGSVTADDTGEGLGLPDMEGVLIGGTSLLAVDFDALLRRVPEERFAPEQTWSIPHQTSLAPLKPCEVFSARRRFPR